MTKKNKAHRVYGGQGSHWEGCHESHWDCLLHKEYPNLYAILLECNLLTIHKHVSSAIQEVRILLGKAYP